MTGTWYPGTYGSSPSPLPDSPGRQLICWCICLRYFNACTWKHASVSAPGYRWSCKFCKDWNMSSLRKTIGLWSWIMSIHGNKQNFPQKRQNILLLLMHFCFWEFKKLQNRISQFQHFFKAWVQFAQFYIYALSLGN